MPMMRLSWSNGDREANLMRNMSIRRSRYSILSSIAYVGAQANSAALYLPRGISGPRVFGGICMVRTPPTARRILPTTRPAPGVPSRRVIRDRSLACVAWQSRTAATLHPIALMFGTVASGCLSRPSCRWRLPPPTKASWHPARKLSAKACERSGLNVIPASQPPQQGSPSGVQYRVPSGAMQGGAP